MMQETLQVYQTIVALLSLGVFAWLYVLGGRHDKWIRRYLGSALFVLGCLALAYQSGVYSPWMQAVWITLPIALSVGYGANTLAPKLRRRAVYGFLVGLALGPFFIPIGAWLPWLAQIGLAIWASLFYGITNPTSAVGEEGVIAVLMVASVPFILIR